MTAREADRLCTARARRCEFVTGEVASIVRAVSSFTDERTRRDGAETYNYESRVGGLAIAEW